jgi:hypothetical protein
VTTEELDKLASLVAQKLAPLTRPRRLLSLEEAGAYMGRSGEAVRQLVKKGVISAVRIDDRVQIDIKALDKLIDQCSRYAA